MKYLLVLAIAYIVYQEVKSPVDAVQTVEYTPRARAFTPIIPLEQMERDELLELIKYFEGFSPTVYRCEAGVDTIGYGITDPAIVRMGEITEDTATKLLREEIALHLSYVDELVEREITPQQRNALASFSFNCGKGSLKKIAARINRGDIEEAGEALLLYVHANGKPSKGLKKRRLIEYQIFNS
jgi:lysozyme